MDKEYKIVSVVLGALNIPNSNGRIYSMDKTQLVKEMEKLIGKPVGEIGCPELDYSQGVIGIINRTTVIDLENRVGTLLNYSIDDMPDGGLKVMGEVKLSDKMERILDNTNPPIKFGIRAMVRPGGNEGKILEVDQLICFDVINDS